MAADANIFAQYLRPVKSVQDYSNDMDAAEQNRLTLQSGRMKAQQDQQAVSDDSALRAAYQQSGGDKNRLLQILQGGGQYKAASALEKQMQDAAKATGDIAHTGAQTERELATAGKTRQETKYAAGQHLSQSLVNVRSPQDIMGYIDAGIQSGVFPAEQRDAMLQKANQAPSVEAWVQAQTQAAIPVLERMKTEAENARNAANNATRVQTTGMTNDVALAGQRSTAATAAAGRAQADRHFNATQENTNKQNGKPPAGYAWGQPGADGNPTLVAVKGGPADLRMVGALNQDTQALTGSMSSFDRLATQANEVLNHPGLAGITGKMGLLPNFAGGDAADAQAKLATLKSQVGFGVLQDMRNNSKTGGALGSVSDAEGKRLEANLAALEKAQSLEQFQSELKKIITYTEAAKGRLREAYNLKHGNAPVKAGGDHPPEINDLLNKYGK